MKINQDKLTINYLTNDISNDLYKVDGSSAVILNASQYIYVGFRKQLSQLFIELEIANINDIDLVVEKYTTAWTPVEIEDETNNLTKSGFIFISDIDGETTTTVESDELYWIRISASASTSSAVLKMINLVFSSEDDLLEDEPDVAKFYPESIDSHIYSLIASRKYIVRKINNGGQHKYNATDLRYSQLNQFDIFDIHELREASNYYALYKIYHNISEADDSYRAKAEDYLEKFNASFSIFSNSKLSLDLEDDGEESQQDNANSIQTVKLTR